MKGRQLIDLIGDLRAEDREIVVACIDGRSMPWGARIGSVVFDDSRRVLRQVEIVPSMQLLVADLASEGTVRDLLLKVKTSHERICFDPACKWKAGILGYLAHCIGASREDVEASRGVLLRYDLECSGCAAHEGKKQNG